jgi:hypothetical protein
MPIYIVYMLIGFIMSAIIVGLSTIRTKEEEKKMVLACYITIFFWPVLLPMFMIAGIMAIKRDLLREKS